MKRLFFLSVLKLQVVEVFTQDCGCSLFAIRARLAELELLEQMMGFAFGSAGVAFEKTSDRKKIYYHLKA